LCTSSGVEVHTAKSDCGEWSILVVTQVMKRAQATQMAGEVAFIDSTGHVDSSLASITVISTNSKIGALPLCVLITKQQTESNFRQGFELFKAHYPEGFGGNVVRYYMNFQCGHNNLRKINFRPLKSLCQMIAELREMRCVGFGHLPSACCAFSMS